MHITAQPSFVQSKMIPMPKQAGVLTHVALNYHEVQCIEFALIGLAEFIRYRHLPYSLTRWNLQHLNAQRNYLTRWVDQPALKSQCRFDGSNTVLWPCTSTELVDWLYRICRTCLTEEAIIIAAMDAARTEYASFSESYLENIDDYSWVEEMSGSQFNDFLNYYRAIAHSSRTTLLGKLADIQTQDYPLYPTHSAIH